MRVAMIAPERRVCGVADYTRLLCSHMADEVRLQFVPIETAVKRLPDLDVDVVHLQYEHGFFLANDDPAGNVDRFLGQLNRPTLVTLHCLPLEDARWQRWLAHRGLAFHVFSRAHAEQLLRWAPTATVHETTKPLPPRVPPSLAEAAIRERLDVGDSPLLAIFGFVKEHKGYAVALAALERLPDEVTLVLAGGAQDAEGEAYLARLQADAAERGLGQRIRVTGYLAPEEIGAVLGAADLVLAPFLSVTASGSLAWAMAWERPVIASALPQFRQIANRWGTPYCVPPGDAAALARAVARLLDSDVARTQLAKAAARARQESTHTHVAAACYGAYRQLVRTTEAPA